MSFQAQKQRLLQLYTHVAAVQLCAEAEGTGSVRVWQLYSCHMCPCIANEIMNGRRMKLAIELKEMGF